MIHIYMYTYPELDSTACYLCYFIDTLHNRFEMPYNIWCGGCGNHIGMGMSIIEKLSKKERLIISCRLFLSIIWLVFVGIITRTLIG